MRSPKNFLERGCKCERAVVMRGNLSEGYDIVGPFGTWELAAEWATNNPDDDSMDWIVDLHDQTYCPVARGE